MNFSGFTVASFAIKLRVMKLIKERPVSDHLHEEHAHHHHEEYDHEHAREVLRQAGYKLTIPRLTILEVLSENGGHLTSTDLLRLVEERDPGIGRASVFRTLELFARLGLVASTGRGATVSYVLLFGGHHHHMICTHCQKLIEFEDCRLGFLTALLREEYGFQHEGHLLEVYGMCRECALLEKQPQQPEAT